MVSSRYKLYTLWFCRPKIIIIIALFQRNAFTCEEIPKWKYALYVLWKWLRWEILTFSCCAKVNEEINCSSIEYLWIYSKSNFYIILLWNLLRYYYSKVEKPHEIFWSRNKITERLYDNNTHCSLAFNLYFNILIFFLIYWNVLAVCFN